MRIIADLHIHSKYSRGCSRDLTLENIAVWCDRKGIGLVGTGDFTHPAWFKDIKELLIEDQPGIYKLKADSAKARFILSTEISCIYSQGGKTRRLHIIILAPAVATVEKIIADFTKRGYNLKSDGRPIISCSAKELARIVLEIDPKCLVIPAHAWTPWFAVFGSKSGFDSLEECFEELTPQIYAIETGLSSDPPMNWQLSALDKITLISNSDAHSLPNLGREANVFDLSAADLRYDEIYRVIKDKDKNKFLYTIEFFPEEGKYHIDGHAACNFSCLPEASQKNNNLCPRCGRPLILGVLNRVSGLADRAAASKLDNIAYKHLIPLQEIIAATIEVGKGSKKVIRIYDEMTRKNTEFSILLDLAEEEIMELSSAEIARAVMSMRLGQVTIEPGYDGIYGKVGLKKLTDKKSQQQKKLF
jgi:uncharacterized protein (TIGR00375 family)